MKKQVKKLALSTDKIVSLTKSQLSNAQGGGPSNGGQSYNCLASSGQTSGGRSRTTCVCL